MKYFKKIIGEKVYLSPMNVGDSEKYTEWLNDPEITQFLDVETQLVTLDGEKKFISNPPMNDYIFAIIDSRNDSLIGNCGIHGPDWINRTAGAGIFIGDKNFHGLGYGSEAMQLLLKFGFTKLNLHNIMLSVYSYNARAYKSYLKVGFKEIGRRRQAKIINNKKHDMIFMDILADEFFAMEK